MVIPDSISLPSGLKATLATAPAEKPVLVTSRNVSATMEVQLRTVILYVHHKHRENIIINFISFVYCLFVYLLVQLEEADA